VGSRKESVPPSTWTESGRTPVLTESSSSREEACPRQSACASRYAAITLAGMRPLARTCMPWSWAQARTASDSPRGAVLAAPPAVTRPCGAAGRPLARALRADFRPEGVFPGDFGTDEVAAVALVAGARLTAGLVVPFVGRFLDPAPFRPAEADRLTDSPATALPAFAATARDSTAFRATRCRPYARRRTLSASS